MKSSLVALSLAVSLAGCAPRVLTNYKGLPDPTNECEVIAYQQQHQIPNLEEIILKGAEQNQTLILGERHDLDADEYFAADLLPHLKDRGYTHLALEREYTLQLHVDKYMRGEIDEAELSEAARALCEPAFSSAYFHLLRKARELGMKVHCIDSHECDNTPDPLDGIAATRDKSMYLNLVRNVFSQDPEAKAVIFIGANHGIETRAMDKCYPREGNYCVGGCGSGLGYYLSQVTGNMNYSVYLGTHAVPNMVFLLSSENENICDWEVGLKEGKHVDLIANPPLEHLQREWDSLECSKKDSSKPSRR